MNITTTARQQWKRRPDFSLARLLDGTAFVILVALLSFIFFAARIANPWMAALPSAIFTGASALAFVLWRQKSLKLKQKALQRQAYDLWLCDEMVKSEERRFGKFVLNILLFQCRYHYVPESDGHRLAKEGRLAHCAVLRRHPSAPVNAQDVLDLADHTRAEGLENLVIATTAEITDDARKLAEAIPGMEITLYDGPALYAMSWDAAMAAPPGALDPYMDSARELLRAKGRQSRFKFSSWGISLRFALTGLMLAVMAWLTPFRTWYLICAAGCLVLGAAAIVFPNLRIFKGKRSQKA